MKRQTTAAIFSGVGAAILAGVVAAVLWPPTTKVGAERPVNPPLLLGSNNSPMLASNPRDPRNVVVVNRIDRPHYSASLEYSANGGDSWHPTELPLPQGVDRPYAPSVAFAPDGSLYVAYVNLSGPSNFPANLWVARSHDGGKSLAPPAQVAGSDAFQPGIAVDRGGTIHVTWVQASGTGTYRFGPPPNPVVASRSVDGGNTFSPPVQVSDPERQRVGAPVPTTDSAGRLLVLYEDYADDARDFENLEGPAWDRPFALVLSKSDDGGASFSRGSAVDSDVVAAGRFVVFTPPLPSIAAGAGGNLYVAWADGRRGGEHVLVRRSRDGGATWLPPVQVDNGNRNGNAYLPTLSLGPSGRVETLFLRRSGDRVDTMLATSTDSGAHFSAIRLSSRPSDARVGPGTPFAGVDPGNRLGLVAGPARVIAAWTDTRLGNPATGRQDVVAATVRHGSGLLPVAASAAVAGALVALLLMAALRMQSRRR